MAQGLAVAGQEEEGWHSMRAHPPTHAGQARTTLLMSHVPCVCGPNRALPVTAPRLTHLVCDAGASTRGSAARAPKCSGGPQHQQHGSQLCRGRQAPQQQWRRLQGERLAGAPVTRMRGYCYSFAVRAKQRVSMMCVWDGCSGCLARP